MMDVTTRAANLAETLLDQVASRDQNWEIILACARELVEVAEHEVPGTGS